MISSIEWVPAGVADPSPKKYEFSQAELDLIKMMENHTVGDGDIQPETSKPEKKKKTTLPKIENNLPADLRMDEYSSDEEENEAATGAAIGRLLVEENEQEIPQNDEGDDDDMENDDDDSDEGDSEDDLEDVPDTREYMPVDLDGLNAMGFSHVGTNAPAYLEDDDDDDDSEADDVRIRSTDSIVVVAKTEDVSMSVDYFTLLISKFVTCCPIRCKKRCMLNWFCLLLRAYFCCMFG